MPDERLKQAMEEIKPVLKKFDCAAVVILASRTHMEYLHEIAPTWSAAWVVLAVAWQLHETCLLLATGVHGWKSNN